MLPHRRKQFAVIGISILFIGMVSAGILLHPKPAAAFPTLTTIIADPWREIKAFINGALKTAIAVAYKSGLQMFLNRVAYDTATYLATGGAGGKPAFITQGWTKYLDDVKDEALGEFFTTGLEVALNEYGKGDFEECARFCVGGIQFDQEGSFCNE